MLAIVERARRVGGFIIVIRLLSPQGLDSYPPSTIHYPLRLRLCRAGSISGRISTFPSHKRTCCPPALPFILSLLIWGTTIESTRLAPFEAPVPFNNTFAFCLVAE